MTKRCIIRLIKGFIVIVMGVIYVANKVQEKINQYEDVRPIPKLNIEELNELDCVRPVNDSTTLLFHCEPVKKYSGACLKCNKSHNL